MSVAHAKFNTREYREFEKQFNKSFNEILPVARGLIEREFQKNSPIRKILTRVVSRMGSPTEYPFIFRFSYQINGGRFERVREVAAAIHLLQVSTFVIDDILDNSSRRDDHKTVYAKYGNDVAIVVGELLQTLSSRVIGYKLKGWHKPTALQVVNEFNILTSDVYQGQFLDLFHSGKTDVTEKSYYELIGLTTGNFLSKISRVGALLAELPNSQVKRLGEFGYCYGMALQICDDIYDVIDTSQQTGKSFARDIKCRRLRLPLIIGLRKASDADRKVLTKYLHSNNAPSYSMTLQIIRILKRSTAIRKCMGIASSFVNRAVGSVKTFPDCTSKRMLQLVALSLMKDLEK